MTRCDFPFEMLSAYVDGQLENTEELEVRCHLDGCARCRELAQSLSALNEAVASTAEVHPVPHSLRERLSQSRAPGRPTIRIWAAGVTAAVLIFAFAVVNWSRKPNVSAVDQLAQALLEDHIRYLNVPDAIQVASSDPQRIAGSFSDRVGFPIQLPQLNDASLLGARFCWIKRNKALLSFYESQGRRFSIFVISRKALPPNLLTKLRCTSSGRYEVCLQPAAPELLAMVGEKKQTQAFLPDFANFGGQQSHGSQK